MSLLGTLLGGGKAPHLRDARASDSADLARIHAASFHRGWGADEFERLLAERAAHAHVICDGPDGAIHGFVLSHVVVPEGEILAASPPGASPPPIWKWRRETRLRSRFTGGSAMGRRAGARPITRPPTAPATRWS